jgi:hypothetical protein
MKAMKQYLVAAIALKASLVFSTPALGANEAPAWKLSAIQLPTNFVAGGEAEYFLLATNVGGKATSGEAVTLKAELPAGLLPSAAFGVSSSDPEAPKPSCAAPVGQEISCTTSVPVHPGRWLGALVTVDVSPSATGILTTKAAVSGGGAVEVKTDAPTTVSSARPQFGFIPGTSGFDSLLTNADSSVASAAGSHPSQLTVALGLPAERSPEGLTAVDHVKDIRTDLPRGLLANPAATPVLCTEAELSGVGQGPINACPRASQVGIVNTMTSTGGILYTTDALYNMVPPRGTAGELGFNAAGVGIFVHPSGSVRSEGDFGIRAEVNDVLAFPRNPIMGATAQVWGDPSSPIHDQIRAVCKTAGGSCPVSPTQTAALTMPSQCTGPITFTEGVTSWEQPTLFRERSVASHDLTGAPIGVEGCSKLEFEPTIEARPSTNLADSPAGFDFNLHQPQDTKLEHTATAILKDAKITLPEGLVVNPAAASGQGVCTVAQIGMTTAVGQSPIHFSKEPASCPDSSKVGTLEAKTPFLAEINPVTNEIEEDADGNAIPRPVHGSVYLAKPFENPFGSLIAIYLDVEDSQSGTVAKFAAEVKPNESTGQLTNVLSESPELPLEDVSLHLFNGPRASLRTPTACATYTTSSDLAPWSAPEGNVAHPADSFAITSTPGGGSCPTDPAAAPNRPSFVAGTVSPAAGAYSPFVMKVSREDGSQPIAGLEMTLPQGLLAKLAGVPYCSEAQIAQAKARSKPEEGALEQANPSCPAASELGSVDAAAGAGPLPMHVGGHVYLAGPYKGAPISFVIITPAVAGPFDLGVVVVRAPVYVDPERAQGRAVSDPLPTILDGIPLDLRSAVVHVDRPDFTLNPTNCDKKEVLASTTSLFGQAVALSSPFQVGGCNDLAFKPQLSLKLKGQSKRTGHPALTGTMRLTPGQANLKQISVTLPRSEFIDQAHFVTICTRVQFAAKQCPAGSIYGYATATTPLLDQPLEGPVYLRSSNHELPDVVLALHGQVDVTAVGRVDSINGGLRTTFENVPDAPATKVVVKLKGAKKGLFINSVNLCKLKPSATRATVKADGQNGAFHDTNPIVKSDCVKSKSHKKAHGKGRRH